MKFSQLPLGARFEFEGVTYIKTSPLLATPETGGAARMIPRWVTLTCGEAAAAPADKVPETVDLARVQEAFDDYHAVCVRYLSASDPQAHAALNEARAHFWTRLGIVAPKQE